MEPKPYSLNWHDDEKSTFLQSCIVKDDNDIFYQKITVNPQLPLYRSLACSLIYDLRNGNRLPNGYLECQQKCDKEDCLCQLLESSVEKIILSYFSNTGKDCSGSEIPTEIFFLACSYITGSKLNVFKTDPKGNMYVYFSPSNCEGTNSKRSIITINILAEIINGCIAYRPLFTFKSFLMET